VQDSLKVLLESADHKVRTYANGLDFLESDHGHAVGCVVLDLDLPIMSGLEVLETLSVRNSTMPVILITGRADKATRERALKTKAVALLEKPIKDGLLLRTIARSLAADGKARADAQ
jgi:two-component system response regulator FixJ